MIRGMEEVMRVAVEELASLLSFQKPRKPSSRDVNGTDIFQLYSNSIRSGRVFIRLYPFPSIQYP